MDLPGGFILVALFGAAVTWTGDAAARTTDLNGEFVKGFDCDFDEDLCGWTQVAAGDDQFDWSRNNRDTRSTLTGPSLDHTSGTGHYLYIETSLPRRSKDKAKLKSPKISTSSSGSGGFCFSFWYHMYGRDVGSLNAYTETDSSAIGPPVWSQIGDRGDKWLQAYVEVNATTKHILIEGVVGTGARGDIAIDDVKLVPGHCFLAQDGICTLEGPKPCGWAQLTDDDFNWRSRKGPTPTANTGPRVDHTYGNANGTYLYIETSDASHSRGMSARLQSPMFTRRDSVSCFELWYHMYGDAIGHLEVSLLPADAAKQNLWSVAGNQGDKWILVQVDIPPQTGDWNIVIEATKGSSFKGDISIDDFGVLSGQCNRSSSVDIQDVYECKLDSHHCDNNAGCKNSIGGYTCTCRDGFSDTNGNGTQCEDINECIMGTNDCDINADCKNTIGGYTCTCRDGYNDTSGNGRNGTKCEDENLRYQVEFRAEYDVQCSLLQNPVSNSTLQILTRGNYDLIINKICRKDCKHIASDAGFHLTCNNNILTVIWLTDPLNSEDKAQSPSSVITKLKGRFVQHNAFFLRLVITNRMPPLIFPRKTSEGIYAAIALKTWTPVTTTTRTIAPKTYAATPPIASRTPITTTTPTTPRTQTIITTALTPAVLVNATISKLPVSYNLNNFATDKWNQTTKDAFRKEYILRAQTDAREYFEQALGRYVFEVYCNSTTTLKDYECFVTWIANKHAATIFGTLADVKSV